MRWRIGLLGAAVVGGLSAWIWIFLAESRRDSNERNACVSLKTLATAEADFRANDRDGNRIQDFWTGDVAELYHLGAAKLIETSIAEADAKPLRKGAPAPVPCAGYYFIAMEVDEDGQGYAQDTGGVPKRGPHFNHAKFAFCAYPADYPRSGKWTFSINEGNTIFKVDTGGKPILRWPLDPSCPKCRMGPPGHAGCGYIQLH